MISWTVLHLNVVSNMANILKYCCNLNPAIGLKAVNFLLVHDSNVYGVCGPLESGPLESGPLESGSLESGSLESGSLESGPARVAPSKGAPSRVAPLRIFGTESQVLCTPFAMNIPIPARHSSTLVCRNFTLLLEERVMLERPRYSRPFLNLSYQTGRTTRSTTLQTIT